MTAVASALPEVDVEDFAFQQSSPHSLRQSLTSPQAQSASDPFYNYDCSPKSDYDGSISGLDSDEAAQAQHDLTNDHRIYSHSSISSFPVSVSQHAVPLDSSRPLSRSTPTGYRHGKTESVSTRSLPMRAERDYMAAFRNPSSVLAMQMRDEDAESIRHSHRRSDSAMSARSMRSSYLGQGSPTKSMARSNQSSPQKGSKLRNEFPLVLLHCNLLGPACNVNLSLVDDELLTALLPEEYRKRWIKLQDKLSNAEVKIRGVLIPHPKEDYELLEERLLESLELERPRIRQNHFFKPSEQETDSGFESASQSEEDNENDQHDGVKCPDCGRKVKDDEDEPGRKWEIKVYAANGLMRAGAWTAAWREMEKVDVEIGLWLSEDVRRDLNTKLEAIAASRHEADQFDREEVASQAEQHEFTPREHEIYGTDNTAFQRSDPDKDFASSTHNRRYEQNVRSRTQPAIPHFITDCIKLVASDWRNIFMVLLGMITVVFSIMGGSAVKETTPGNASSTSMQTKSVELLTTTVTSTAVWTSTIVESATTLGPSVSCSTLIAPETVDPATTYSSTQGSTVLSSESQLPLPEDTHIVEIEDEGI